MTIVYHGRRESIKKERRIEGIQNKDYIKVKIMPKTTGRIKRKKRICMYSTHIVM